MAAVNESTKYTNFSNVSIGSASGGGALRVGGTVYTAAEVNAALAHSSVTDNVGTVGTNVTAVEAGNATNHLTTLTLASVAYTIGDNAALADGALVYTFPAGVIAINSVSCSLGLTLTTGTPTTDTPEIGLGTVIGSGVNATLGDVAAGAEDIAGPAVMDDVAGTAEIFSNATPQILAAADVHLVHVNIADTWADVDDTAATMSGSIYINWSFLGA